MGIQALAWKAYTEKFMPSILKMADLKHTSVSRFGAANIIAATTNYAAENKLLTESLLQTFLHLCEDPDIVIRKSMLSYYHILLPKLRGTEYEEKLKEEIIDTLKDTSSSLRILATEIIFMHQDFFDVDLFKNDFAPEIINEIQNTFNYSNNWLFDHFAVVADFLIVHNLVQKDYIGFIEKYINVTLIHMFRTLNKLKIKK